tara:strand:+ start:1007 stop:1177 length:171 start_codon:yes stop_codon:yes gene_type:complete
MVVELKLDESAWHDLLVAAQTPRSKEVSVNKAALATLITDHGKLIEAFKNDIGGQQ